MYIKKFTQEYFIKRASKLHDNFYDYSKIEYKNLNSKLLIICPIHGQFEQTAKQHFTLKRGCKKCSDNRNSLNMRGTPEHYINCARKVHGDKYDYSLVKFNNYRDKIDIICPKHGIFKQKASKHLYDKQGCRKCVMEQEIFFNFTRSRWIKITSGSGAYLYLVKFTSEKETFYKIGITKNILTRFHVRGLSLFDIKLVDSLFEKVDTGIIYDLERKFHREQKSLRYKPLQEFDGCTECYKYCDEVLRLFKENIKDYESKKICKADLCKF